MSLCRSKYASVNVLMTHPSFDLQELAVDLMFYYSAISEATVRTLALLCLTSTYPVALATRALSVLSHAMSALRVAPETYLSLILAVLVGRTAQAASESIDQSYERAVQLVDAACQGMQSFPGGAGTLSPRVWFLLTKPLCKCWEICILLEIVWLLDTVFLSRRHCSSMPIQRAAAGMQGVTRAALLLWSNESQLCSGRQQPGQRRHDKGRRASAGPPSASS